jgi:hypothetical protein
MTTFARLTWQAAVAGRWTARILGTLMVLFLLAFVFGEGLPSLARMTAREQFYALCLGGMFLGLIVAWFWEGWGGLLSVLGWGLLGVIAKLPVWLLPFSIPPAIGLLHLLCWWRLRSQPAAPAPGNAAGRAGFSTLYTLLWVALAAFVLMCANEIFGNPPLMTGTGRLPAEMAGTWHASLTMASRQPPDGSVSGTVGDATLTNGEFIRNRSWFGRLMNWRTDYMIRGTLSQVVESYGGAAGDRFSAPVNPRGPELDGSLFLSHPGVPKPLGLNLKKQ